ncbi:glucosylceramidase-like [Ceratina calcarata]|uniref:Glucosylceramidase n=1 Tax=Ceratina calcarata TaxID=156304 RepID=A0AAJ7RY62_9HYME|nr:glucosylceramidase-like [Ceratina calcarata]
MGASLWNLLLLFAFLFGKGSAHECAQRSFGPGRIVCVCNATYCDSTPDNDPKIPQTGTYYWYVSTQDGLRLDLKKGKINSCQNSSLSLLTTKLDIDTTKTYQTILGYGAAFTDSAGINVKKLSPATQDQLIRAYYDPVLGSRYLLGRIPIGGTDFSTRAYTYDDHANDTTLAQFALAPEDYSYKIPFLQKALELNPEVKFLSAAWSAPAWMKTNDNLKGFGFLKKEYYQLYSDYLLKFLDEYKKNGIDVWAVSSGNEPINTIIPFDPLNTMGWTPDRMGEWIAENFGPTLANSKHNTVILALDDQRVELPWFIQELFKNEKAKKYTAGTAVHPYVDFLIGPEVLDKTHDLDPDKFILLTEASLGSEVFIQSLKVIPGSWNRGKQYMESIIQYMNHWSVGWVDWNYALNPQGGPTYTKNYVDSPIIVSENTDEFYKNPMYYAIKHFSRFVDRGSVRVSISDSPLVKATAFVTPSKEVVTVLYNE